MATTTKKAVEPKTETVITYKGFDANLQCRGFQYEIGATYTTEKVEVCASGFHACENPLDVLNYYSLLNDDAKPNRFCVVEQGGEIQRHEQDSKVASAKITITAELDVGEFIKRAVKWVVDACKSEETAASGDYAQLAASGNSAKLAASGNYAKLAASGNYAKLAASGDYAQLAASGDYAKLAASGYYAQLAASGDYAQLAASGNSAKLAASGNYAKLAASGNYAKLAASGADSVIASSSYNSSAKGVDGTWISLAEFDDNGKCIGFATGCVGKDGIPADTWLKALNGKLVSA